MIPAFIEASFTNRYVNPPTNAKFANTQEVSSDTILFKIGNFSLNGDMYAVRTTSFLYWKKQGIVAATRTGRNGPPNTKSNMDRVCRKLDHNCGDANGACPLATATLYQAAANIIPCIRLAMKLYDKTTIAPRYTNTANASTRSE